jgi:hypothetical protein
LEKSGNFNFAETGSFNFAESGNFYFALTKEIIILDK